MSFTNPEDLDFSDFSRANTFDVLTGHSWPTWTTTPPTTRTFNNVIWQPVDEFDYGMLIPGTSNWFLFFMSIQTNHTFFNQETTTWNGQTIFENWETYVSPYINISTGQLVAPSIVNPLEFWNVRILKSNTPQQYWGSRTEDIPTAYFLGQVEYDPADQPFEFQSYEIDANTFQYRAVANHGDY